MCELYEGLLKMEPEELEEAEKEMHSNPNKIEVACMAQCKAHAFHKDCLVRQKGKKDHLKCAVCGVVYGTIIGDMPPGNMRWEKNKNYTCSGYEGNGAIMIRYDFPDGIR